MRETGVNESQFGSIVRVRDLQRPKLFSRKSGEVLFIIDGEADFLHPSGVGDSREDLLAFRIHDIQRHGPRHRRA